jgi:hypothetical protein
MNKPGPRVVSVGGGFRGLGAAKALGKAPTQNIVIDRMNHHVFHDRHHGRGDGGCPMIISSSPLGSGTATSGRCLVQSFLVSKQRSKSCYH